MSNKQRTTAGGNTFDSTGSIINIADSYDVFSQLRTVEYTPIVERKPLPGVSFLRDRIDGPGTVGVVSGEIQIDATEGATALYTRDYGRYLPGIVGLAGIGVRIPDPATGAYEYGYGNGAGNRVGIEWTNGEPFTFIESGGVRHYRKPRSEWLDRLDGTGVSGIDFDFSQGHILRIPFGWYGYLSVIWAIAIAQPGGDRVVIIDRSGGRANGVSIEQPDLPVFAEANGGMMYVGGRQFGVYGRYNPKQRATSSRNIRKTVSDTSWTPIVTYRVKNDPRWRGVPVQLLGVGLLATENVEWELVVGAELTGAVFGDLDGTPPDETALEVDSSATALTGGVRVYGDNSAGGQGNTSGTETAELPDLNLPRELGVTLAARRITAGTATVDAVLRAKEEW